MNSLCDYMYRENYSDLNRSLRYFFRNVKTARRYLKRGGECGLNRIQRIRCMDNMQHIFLLEREFANISNYEDSALLYNYVAKYLHLEPADLLMVLGKEEIARRRLFL